jgi:protein-disulfide isomerase
MALIPVLVITGILAATAVVGFGAVSDKSQQQVKQEVTELLAGIPQDRTTLGSPKAPITVLLYGDLECPTVKLFFESYLPSIVERWVRSGDVKLEYRSLQTDTVDEGTYFEQEAAALAAGRQDKMWNFILTFAYEQGDASTDYATDEFLTDIAFQVPGLKPKQWRQDRQDARLKTQVALGAQSARARGFRYTPSFSLGFTSGKDDRSANPINKEFQASLLRDLESLRQEAFGDVPGIRAWGLSVGELGTERGEKQN